MGIAGWKLAERLPGWDKSRAGNAISGNSSFFLKFMGRWQARPR
jgi:hypothetical protein